MDESTPKQIPNPYDAPAVPAPASQLPAEEHFVPDQFRQSLAAYFEQGRNGAAWFYWIAGLSLVNSAVALSGGNIGFALGLGVTTIADAVALAEAQGEVGSNALVIAGCFDAIVLGMVALCGWLSQKRILFVFALGMVLYFLDGLIFLLWMDVISIGIHAFALWCMWTGFSAYRKLNALERQLSMPTAADGMTI